MAVSGNQGHFAKRRVKKTNGDANPVSHNLYFCKSEVENKGNASKEINDQFIWRDFLSEPDFKLLGVGCMLVFMAVASVQRHSGQGDAPKFGDYEAQRHWMEITVNMPVRTWYENSTQNDLSYWGLDYPPLTAYHSYAVGQVAKLYNASWVELGMSRGIETNEHKAFMRLSVIATMLLVYCPVVLELYQLFEEKDDKISLLYSALFFPALIYVDCAHFQYNHICLALAMRSFLLFMKERYVLGSVLFVLALNFKQMALYYALPVFVFLLSKGFEKGFVAGCKNVIKLAVTVTTTFTILWFPYLYPDPRRALQVLHRIFPVSRGLFEDIAGTFWCSSTPVFRWKTYEPGRMLAASCALVLLLSLPALYALLRRPSAKRFKQTLFLCSTAFFLFSFQVHEKTVLFPALASFLIMQYHPRAVTDFLFSASASLYPLINREGSDEIYPLILSYLLLIHRRFHQAGPAHSALRQLHHLYHTINPMLFLILAACVFAVPPPDRFPHLWPLFTAQWSFLNFFSTFLFVYAHTIKEYVCGEDRKRKRD